MLRYESGAKAMTATARGPDLSGLDVDTLLEDAEAFEAALEAAEGPVAVVGAPFGGRSRVLDHAAEALDADRMTLDPSANRETLVEALGDGPLVVDDCQHLYERRVGGFESLAATLGALAKTSELVVTGWNSYAWSYLDAVRDVEDVFVHRFFVRKLPPEDIASFVRDHTESLPTFRHDERDADLLTIREHSLGEGRLTVPVPVLERDRLRAVFETTDDPETAVFNRLAGAADGNPGVALALWERSRRGGEIRPSDVASPSVDLDHAGAFLLRVVLSQSLVSEAMLADRFGVDAERPLGRLERAGIVSREAEGVRLEPTGVPAAIDATERRRIL
jgi:hypothetical protein